MTFTQHTNVPCDAGKANKKQAGIAMCLSSVLLFLFPVISSLAVTVLQIGIPVIMKLLTGLLIAMGVEKMQAVAVSAHLLSSAAFSTFADMVITTLSLVLPAFVFSKCVKMESNDAFPCSGKLVKGFFRVYCAMQIIVLFAGVFSNNIYDFLIRDSKIDPGGTVGFSGIEFDGFMLAMRIIHICVFVPIIEEYVFRGVVFGYLKRYGVLYGIFASAVVFGIAHAGPTQSVYAFVFGVFSAFLVALTGNIKTSILFHAMNNAISILNELMLAYLPDSTAYFCNSFYNIVTLFAGFLGLYLLAKKDGILDSFRVKCIDGDDRGENAAGMKQIFVLPVIFFVLIFVARVLMTAV